MRVLISVLLLHLHAFGYSGAVLGAEQSCALPTLDESEFEIVELIFENEADLKEKLNDPKMQEYFRKHLSNNGGSCEEEETTTTITTTATTGSVQPPTITTDNDGEGPTKQPETTTSLKETTTVPETSQPTSTLPNTTTDPQDISTTNTKTTEPVATSAQTTEADETTHTKMITTEPAVTSAETTQAKVSTTEVSVETSKETTTEEATTVTPTCAPLNKIDDCDIVYNGKCYFFYESPFSNSVSFQDAKQYCENHESQLGNIYDDCHYQYILETIAKTKYNHWTGMKVSFSPSVDVILRSGERAKSWNGDWWFSEEYPKDGDGDGRNLLITTTLPFPRPQRRGITNADGNDSENKMMGAFCERNLP